MPKRKSKVPSPKALGVFAASALVVFLAGEALLLSRSEPGQLSLAKSVGQRERVVRLVGRQLHHALEVAGIPSDSVTEGAAETASHAVHVRVGLKPGTSLLQVNYALTQTLERRGAAVLEGREVWPRDGSQVVTLVVGLPNRPTHEVRLVRMPVAPGTAREPARLALVVYGFGESEAFADSFFSLPVPFAVAVAPGRRQSAETFRGAHRRNREVVLHLPLEPVNYPQVDPGAGTLLVTMRPGRISGELRHSLDQALPVTAVANLMGSLATQDMSVMRAIYHELRRSGVPFLHVAPVPGAVCKSLAADMGIAYRVVDATIEDETLGKDARALDRRWAELLRQTAERGRLVVMVRATPRTLAWLPQALDPKRLDGVAVVPLAALVHRPLAL